MHKAKFEITCENPGIVKNAVEVDDKAEVKYTVMDSRLILEIESECLRTLMKIAYSACNRVQLSIETLNKFKK